MENVSDLVKRIKEVVEVAEKDAEKCDKGNRQAGIRVRKSMFDMIALAKDARKCVIDNR